MAFLFAAAQLLDLFTYHPSYEANPIVIALGHYAPATKALLIVAILLCLPHMGRYGRWVLGAGIVVGLIGAASNVWAMA